MTTRETEQNFYEYKVTLVFEHIVALFTLKHKEKVRTLIVPIQYRTSGEGFAIDEGGV